MLDFLQIQNCDQDTLFKLNLDKALKTENNETNDENHKEQNEE